MTSTRPVRRAAALTASLTALLLAGAGVLPAAPSAAETADEQLLQTIDPDQAQGTGQVVVDRGHVDFGPTLSTGEWIVQIHDDTGTPKYWRNPEDVVMKVGDAGTLTVPEGEAYAFLHQAPGTEVWVVPQTRNADVVWTGWNTQEPTVLESLNLGTTLRIHGVDGPGDVSVFLQSGNFGDPQPLWSTFDAFPQETWIEVNTHTHANWVFTEPGVYLVEIEFEADLIDGSTVSARDVLRYAVGDETDAEAAFAAVYAGESTASRIDSSPEPAAEPSTPDDLELGTVMAIVLAAVAAALVAAVVVVMAATRRAKARARARSAGSASTDR
ncbi:choice-of-anchor M domain-containing protein [Agromyces aerolatus]|uniref:choice-of-anchor M domain-containing protein n=1 Tax=Agromyces sp. LY-1074 TaxID=3074080 RepID=UPI002861B005|nr:MULTISPECIES: choice-of-anchor M domain-containing protein [unclassified Agromyces]MDR5700862.1 choice-of-anchor M domain-containing protein [Agromyces sp. LY-1074]MDR5707477.1 choice-of-anchor M domain-containing protein [Agromyces sp. LY-1358]